MPELVAARAVEKTPAPQRPWHWIGRPEADEKDPAAHRTQMEELVAASAVE
jgi:hypothetical protein